MASKVPTKQTKRRKPSSWERFKASRYSKLVPILLFALVGTYFIAFGAALPGSDPGIQEPDNLARGLVYNGKKEATKGPCKGTIDVSPADAAGIEICSHPDPGPEGVDVRERDKHVDSDLVAQVGNDAKNQPLAADSTTIAPDIQPTGAADTGSANSLGVVTPVNWPCVGTGTDGYRVQMIYAYASGASNRVSYVRPGFETIARRVNAVFHNSGVASGGVRNVRYVTSSTCVLSLPAIPITGNISDVVNITNQLKARGYGAASRKYLTLVDGGSPCGWGTFSTDPQPGQANYNNIGPNYATVWHPCWNYEEAHELMHTLGAVLTGAPYSTGAAHCYDQHDVMCYTDTSGKAMIQRCTSTTYIWRFDCGYDTYFRSVGATGWLYSHWNTANSRFLSHT